MAEVRTSVSRNKCVSRDRPVRRARASHSALDMRHFGCETGASVVLVEVQNWSAPESALQLLSFCVIVRNLLGAISGAFLVGRFTPTYRK
jgi:hypothetical protein